MKDLIQLVHVVEKQFRSIHLFRVCYLRYRSNQKTKYQKKGLYELCYIGYIDEKYKNLHRNRKKPKDNAKIAEKKGQVVDWNKVLNDSHDARAIGRENQVRAVGEKK